MPGMHLPLRFSSAAEVALANAILQAPDPYTRLLTIVRTMHLSQCECL